jgi:ERCC4-type nuclease
MKKFKVSVDDREVGSDTVAALRGMGDVEVMVARLAVGDYVWEDRMLFERKSLMDLVASIKDGRLFRQGAALAASPLHGVMILEGTMRDLAAIRMRREAMQGALISLTLFLGIPLLRAMDGEETARLMYYAACQHRAVTAEALPRLVPARRPRGKRRTQLHLLQGFPGIGPTRARRLLEQFGSIEAILTATAEELAQVSGVGQRTAETIRWAVSEQAQGYEVCGEDPVL